MTARKPLEPGCTTGIFCPIEGHLECVPRARGRVVYRHIKLTEGQKREHRAKVLAELKAASAWREEQFGPFNYATGDHADGTSGRDAAAAYRKHLGE